VDSRVSAARARLALWDVHGDARDLAVAEKLVEEARRRAVDPGNPLLRAWRQEAAGAVALAGSGSDPSRAAAAAALLEDALRVYVLEARRRHGHALLRLNLAWAHAAAGRREQATEHLVEAASQARGNPEQETLVASARAVLVEGAVPPTAADLARSGAGMYARHLHRRWAADHAPVPGVAQWLAGAQP
jgi:hypothetical protein